MIRHAQRGFRNLYILKTVGVPTLVFGPLILREHDNTEDIENLKI